MAVERMGLKEAGELLGITRNAVKARISAQKLEGQRDNAGKWWVLIDREKVPTVRQAGITDSETDTSNDTHNAIEKSGLFEALTSHIDTLKVELAAARQEVAMLRPQAEAADRLQAELEGLRSRYTDKAGEVDRMAKLLETASVEHRQLVADLLARLPVAPPPALAEQPSWFARLFGKGKS